MTASIQIKKKRYYVVLSWKEGDGTRKQKWIKTDYREGENCKRSLERTRLEVLEEWKNKITENGSDILFSDYMKQWLEEIRQTVAQSTYFTYCQTVHGSICPWFAKRKIRLCDLKPYDIQEFYRWKMDNDGVSPNTIHHYHANIHKALRHAVKAERITSNPADNLTLPKKQKHIARHYSEEEVKILLEKIKGTLLEPIVYLAIWFGLRRGEIIGLKWDCIDFENRTLSVLGTIKDKGGAGTKTKTPYYEPTAKTASSIRTLPMPQAAVDYLLELKQTQEERKAHFKGYNHTWDDFVCVKPTGDLISLEYASRAFPRLCEKYGLPRINLHELRHTNISLLLEAGAGMKVLQEWAGHSSYSTTANIYSHIQAKTKGKLADYLQNMLG